MSELGFWPAWALGVGAKLVGGGAAALPRLGAIGLEGCPNPPVAVDATGWVNGELLEELAPNAVTVPKPVVVG